MVGSRIRYTACPGCGSVDIRAALTALDHTVTEEAFEIWECDLCSLRFTQGIPTPEEIQDYYRSDNYVSHTDTEKGFVNRLYHLVRKRTLEKKFQIISGFTGLKSGKLLDLGAGTGAFFNHMQRKGWELTGLEPDEGARRVAGSVHGIKLQGIDRLPDLEENFFDAITLWHVLEHLHPLHQDLGRLKKILQPEGLIFIAVPNYTSYDAGYYKANWAAYDVPRHLYHFSPQSMKALLKSEGLRLHSIRPMWYDSIYISLLSEKYKRGHSNLWMGVSVGAISNFQAIFEKERCSSLIYIAGK
jgi:2-polyprenyl-3-methyl-5-hydroxy-6-metoxy-1,4-benzoquinol methylase